MKSQPIDSDGSADIRVVVLDDGEEAFSSLQAFARETGISAASLTAIGAFEQATVGWFDFASKTYKEIEVNEQCEVLSAIGDIAVGDTTRPASTFTSCSASRTARPEEAISLEERSIRRWRSC